MKSCSVSVKTQLWSLNTYCLPAQDRLATNYYRNADAVKHDAALLHSNAVLFNGADTDLAQEADVLSQFITACVDGVDPPDIFEGYDDEDDDEDEGSLNPVDNHDDDIHGADLPGLSTIYRGSQDAGPSTAGPSNRRGNHEAGPSNVAAAGRRTVRLNPRQRSRRHADVDQSGDYVSHMTSSGDDDDDDDSRGGGLDESTRGGHANGRLRPPRLRVRIGGTSHAHQGEEDVMSPHRRPRKPPSKYEEFQTKEDIARSIAAGTVIRRTHGQAQSSNTTTDGQVLAVARGPRTVRARPGIAAWVGSSRWLPGSSMGSVSVDTAGILEQSRTDGVRLRLPIRNVSCHGTGAVAAVAPAAGAAAAPSAHDVSPPGSSAQAVTHRYGTRRSSTPPHTTAAEAAVLLPVVRGRAATGEAVATDAFQHPEAEETDDHPSTHMAEAKPPAAQAAAVSTADPGPSKPAIKIKLGPRAGSATADQLGSNAPLTSSTSPPSNDQTKPVTTVSAKKGGAAGSHANQQLAASSNGMHAGPANGLHHADATAAADVLTSDMHHDDQPVDTIVINKGQPTSDGGEGMNVSSTGRPMRIRIQKKR